MKSIFQTLLATVAATGFTLGLAPSTAQAQTASEDHIAYVLQCIDEVAEIRDFSCGEGEVVPITVDGVEITPDTFEPQMNCDRPALLSNGDDSDGQCVPGSRILNLSTEQSQVSAMCRQKHNRPADSLMFDEIDIISHNPSTGATCWFQAKSDDPNAPLDGNFVNSPTNLEAPNIWEDPEKVAKDYCGDCHDNDPFMYSPFVGQVWNEVPSNPLGPYYNVDDDWGFSDWPTTSLDMRDNTCVGCHRIGIGQTCDHLTKWMTGQEVPKGADLEAWEFPLSHAMPPEHGQTHAAWSTFHSRSVAEIKSCCHDPSQQMCNATEIPRYDFLE